MAGKPAPGRSARDRMRLFAALVVVALVAPRAAYGYIDPLTGSVILQILAAGVLAAALTVRNLWARVTAPFRRLWKRIAR